MKHIYFFAPSWQNLGDDTVDIVLEFTYLSHFEENIMGI